MINTTQNLSLRFGNEAFIFVCLLELIKIKHIIKSKLIKLQIKLLTKGYFYQEYNLTSFSMNSIKDLDFEI